MTTDDKLIIGITQGDVNGIGLEVILKTLIEPAMSEICTPVLFSSQKTVSYYRKVLGLEEFNFNPMRDFTQLNTRKPNVMVCYEEEVNIEMGKASDVGGKYAHISLDKATQALQNGDIHAIVTGPINKQTIQSAQFHYPGHTEYFGAKFGGDPLMLLCSSGGLRLAVVTGHLPLREVADRITTDKVLQKIEQLHFTLVSDFGIRKPKIAVLGLNPHAGDNGTIGTEDRDSILPAIKKAAETKLVLGPYSADGFFGSNTHQQFDAVLAMYHDQGLIPFKTLAFNTGVNYTAGLPIVRTSPDHGTAFDMAGKGIANEQSFKNAIYMAIDVYRNRQLHGQISANPLAFSHIKKER